MTVGLCYDVSISKIHLQERCKMEMLYAICDAATGPLIETDHIFGIVVFGLCKEFEEKVWCSTLK